MECQMCIVQVQVPLCNESWSDSYANHWDLKIKPPVSSASRSILLQEYGKRNTLRHVNEKA